MSDIFISYSREDRPEAERLAGKLIEQGFTVWWDRKISAGERFDRVIGEALETATCVIVLWSATSVDSDWVKEEAERGKQRDALIPVKIEDVLPPLGFGQIEAAELWGWDGNPEHVEFKQLVAELRYKTGHTGTHPADVPIDPLQPAAKPTSIRRRFIPEQRRGLVYSWAGFGTAIALFSAGFWQFDRFPMWGKRLLSGHVREAQAELDSLRGAVPDPPVANAGLLDGFTGLLERHERHLRKDFTAADTSEVNRQVATQNTLVAQDEFARLQSEFDSTGWSNADLLDSLDHLATEHGDYLAGAEHEFIATARVDLRREVDEYAAVATGRDTLVMTEELRLLDEMLADRPRPGTLEDRAAQARRDTVVDAQSRLTTVTDIANSSTCRDVVANECVGTRDTFPAGSDVYLWARVAVPGRRETLTVEWIGPRGDAPTLVPITVQRSSGFRLHGSRRYDTPGTYEVRLYNSERFLIARRVFTIQ